MADEPRPTLDSPPQRGPGYETRDANVPMILFITLLLVLLCGVAFWLAGWTFASLEAREDRLQRTPHPLAERDEPPPGPHLQADPPRDLARYLSQQSEILETYGWIDPVAGIVRVPVERALELVLEEGLPSREPDDPQGVEEPR